MNPQWNFAKGLQLGNPCRAKALLQSYIEGSSFAAFIFVHEKNYSVTFQGDLKKL